MKKLYMLYKAVSEGGSKESGPPQKFILQMFKRTIYF